MSLTGTDIKCARKPAANLSAEAENAEKGAGIKISLSTWQSAKNDIAPARPDQKQAAQDYLIIP